MNASNLFRTAIGGLSMAAVLTTPQVGAQVRLADQPVFSAVNVPGNLALALSVEFPTAISVAHPTRTYTPATTYIGYFDPAKCYAYRYTDGADWDNYFYPVGTASSHTCSNNWSGNYLNWASMQTIDPFRSALTGGYRAKDTATLTVLEKAWASAQGSTSNFPDSTISTSAIVSGATPFSGVSTVATRIWGLGNKIRFTTPSQGGDNDAKFTAKYYNNKTLNGAPVLSEDVGFINYNVSGTWFPSGVNTTNMSVQWNGKVKAPTTGNYNFKARADDGVRLTVQVNNGPSYTLGDTGWKDQGATDYILAVPNVQADDTLNVTMQYYQAGGGAEVSLQWQPPAAAGYSSVGGGGLPSFTGTATHYNGSSSPQKGVLYEAFVRVKVCDPSGSAGGIEANCTAYDGNNFKPTGLMQRYSDKIRYSAFGYLNDGDLKRDGGVLRAAQKFIGPTKPVPGGLPILNPLAEWNAGTGVMADNPDSTDADATHDATGVTVGNSGVMNYLNKFGEITPGSYKTYDPVGELYYAAQRYFRNIGNVPEYTSMGAASPATKKTWVDGFPVITDWKDPILYYCQRNFILGIGDVNTHADRNLPGATGSSSEPGKPEAVSHDTGVDAMLWTNKVDALQFSPTKGLAGLSPYNGCCNNNSALMAGLAYWANVNDIRPDLVGKQTIQTYWLDVLEYGAFKSFNQYYLAAKYGGFSPPADYNPATATYSQFTDTAPTKFWWSTTADKTPDNASVRPDNYYTAAKADQMVQGLNAAFNSIATKLKANSTAFSTSLPQVSALGENTYSALYDTSTWTGEVVASSTTFEGPTLQPELHTKWQLSTQLATQAAGTGWNTARNIVTYNTSSKTGVPFRSGAGGISSAQLAALDTSYVAGVDGADYLNYLRGDRTREVSSGGAGPHVYRDRANLVGDIVNAKVRPVGPPSLVLQDANNAGYEAFKSSHSNRRTMVYVSSNDGMLHAIDGSLTGPTAGKEVWAYIPGVLFDGPTGTPSVNGLASIGNPTFLHHYMVDATPLNFDIDFGKTPGGTVTDWRSVLIGGLGKGGKAIYALDITDPDSVTSEATAATKVLWEFTDPDLGYGYGTPVAVKTNKYGWTLVFSSGYNNADGKGYIFFVNPRNGALLEKVAVPCGSCTATNQMGLAHLNAFVNDYRDGHTDAIYGGDLMGNVWRLDVRTATDPFPAPVKFATLENADGTALPVTTKVLMVVDPETDYRWVTVGTGRLLDVTDISDATSQRFFAFVDGNSSIFDELGPYPITVDKLRRITDVTLTTELNYTTEKGWFLDLRSGSASVAAERVVIDSTSFNGSVTFVATTPSTTDACSPSGTSRLFSLSLSKAKTVLADGRPYYAPDQGAIIDVNILSINKDNKGTPSIIAGRDCLDCPVRAVQIDTNALIGIQRMNWREIIVPN